MEKIEENKMEIKTMDFSEIEPEGNVYKFNFKNSKKNLLKIVQDTQGINYNNYTREQYVNFRRRQNKNFRCNQIDPNEKIIINKFKENQSCDIFYSFNKFMNRLPIHITHFQVRKNFLKLRENEIAYTTENGIQSYNLLNNMQIDLCTTNFTNEILNNQLVEERYVICFDIIETNEGHYLIATGNSDGTVRLLKINKEEIFKMRKNRFLKDKTKFENVCNEIIAVGSSEEILTNYVKFIEKGKYLLTTSNDCNIRIYSLEEKLVQICNYKSEYPINHCSFNYNIEEESNFQRTLNSGNNILASIGDSNFIELFDVHNKSQITKFRGHYDIGTVIRFIGNGYDFATGNQDITCKIWDLRKVNNLKTNEMQEPKKTLCGRIDSIGDIAMINSEMFAFFENKDLFHIYNMKYDTVQTIDYVGLFAGIVYQKCYDKLHLAIKENDSSGILTYEPIKNYRTNLDRLLYF